MSRMITLFFAVALLYQAESQAADKYPLRQDLSGFHRTVTTKSPEAQKYFDQGFTLYYGFNHEAAIYSFAEAAKLDSTCAMAYWGQALSVGPNYNNMTMDSVSAKAAWDNAQQALKLSSKSSRVEKDLIEALSSRYVWPTQTDRKALDQAYANAMREVWLKYQNDADVAALFAESLMDLRPWALFNPDGQPVPGTAEIMSTLEKAMELVPDHPGANHFYIHTVEMSPFPQLALPSADLLRYLIPGAGHLVHMPAHIYMRLGRYDDAIKANQRGISADSGWATSQGGFYTIYRAHNYHFLAYAAMFEGRQELAMKAARDMIDQVPLELVRAFPDFMDAFIGQPIHVMIRFGLWEQVLAEPKPPEDLLATTAFWHYGRTVAYAALGKVKEADAEFTEFKKTYDAVPESRLFGNNPARTVLKIGMPMAEGELEYRKGNYEHAFELLRAAVKLDDSLKYDEPWGWMMPVRHSLGALLLEQNKFPEAESVYREDLRLHPENGWALKGLAECLRKTNRTKEAEETEVRFNTSWARSDIKIKASCFCRKDS